MHSPASMFEDVLTENVMHKIAQIAESAFTTTIDEWLGGEHKGKGVFFRAGFFVQAPQGFVPYEFMSMWRGGQENRDDEIKFRGQSAEKYARLLQKLMERGDISAAQSKSRGLNFKGAICFKVNLGPKYHAPGVDPVVREAYDLDDQYVIMWLAASGVPDDADEAGLVETARQIGDQLFILVEPDELSQILALGENIVFQGKL